MVTAELAVAIPCVILVLALCLSALRLGIDAVAVTDAARVGARALAREDDVADAVALAESAAPGAKVTTARAGTHVVVTVRRPAPVLLARLGVPGVAATATIPVEVAGASASGVPR